ncbi:MAG: hypothetical protein AAB308_11290, partial [Nitrospirota bacterium]
WEAACAATYLHGVAGDLAATRKGQAGLISRDVLEMIPYALKLMGQAPSSDPNQCIGNDLV